MEVCGTMGGLWGGSLGIWGVSEILGQRSPGPGGESLGLWGRLWVHNGVLWDSGCFWDRGASLVQGSSPPLPRLQQQLQAHQLSQLQALALPLTPLPVGLQPPSLPAAVSAGTGLLSLSALGPQAHLAKEDKNGHDGDAHQDEDGDKSD